MSLNSVKVNWGTEVANLILELKTLDIGNTAWFELELLPGEKNAEETKKEKLRKELCQALYDDLRQSYPNLTLSFVIEVEKLLAGEEPKGIIQMFAQSYMFKLGLLKEREIR